MNFDKSILNQIDPFNISNGGKFIHINVIVTDMFFFGVGRLID